MWHCQPPCAVHIMHGRCGAVGNHAAVASLRAESIALRVGDSKRLSCRSSYQQLVCSARRELACWALITRRSSGATTVPALRADSACYRACATELAWWAKVAGWGLSSAVLPSRACQASSCSMDRVLAFRAPSTSKRSSRACVAGSTASTCCRSALTEPICHEPCVCFSLVRPEVDKHCGGS